MYTVNNINKSFFHRTILEDISFKVDHGDIIALLGKNGIGKSTLLRILGKISQPDTGEIFYNDLNIKKEKKDKVRDKKFANIKKTIKEYQKFIKNNLKYVGENFAYEARLIHYKDKKKVKGGIYGNASLDQLKELKEEGIETEIVPWVNEKDN